MFSCLFYLDVSLTTIYRGSAVCQPPNWACLCFPHLTEGREQLRSKEFEFIAQSHQFFACGSSLGFGAPASSGPEPREAKGPKVCTFSPLLDGLRAPLESRLSESCVLGPVCPGPSKRRRNARSCVSEGMLSKPGPLCHLQSSSENTENVLPGVQSWEKLSGKTRVPQTASAAMLARPGPDLRPFSRH